MQIENKKSQSSISEESFNGNSARTTKRNQMIKIMPKIAANAHSFNEAMPSKRPQSFLYAKNDLMGEENLENADDLNCVPAFNLRKYGTSISNQPPKKMLNQVQNETSKYENER